MNYKDLYKNILAKRSFLCVGLDSDPALFPTVLQEVENPIYEFNRAIITQTAPYAVAYKLNLAFYEAEGEQGWRQLRMTVDYLKTNYPDILIMADAKRGDIGNTAKRYARAFFETLSFDAVTLAPYMGEDSIKPFLQYEGKWTVVLALTSNPGADDFELQRLEDGMPLYEKVIRKTMELGSEDNTMFVIGATRPGKLREIRRYCPHHFFLVPGVGAQGGTIKEVAENGMNDHCGILINASRSIIFADNSAGYALAAGRKAKEMAQEMSLYLTEDPSVI